MTDFNRQFARINEEGTLEELEAFRSESRWKALASEERQLLAALFVRQGAQQLARQEPSSIETFSIAQKVAPQSASISLAIGIAFAKQNDNICCLEQAKDYFCEALRLDPCLEQAISCVTQTYMELGKNEGDAEILQEGLHRVKSIMGNLPTSAMQTKAQLLHSQGLFWFRIAEISGELCDYQQALKVVNQGIQTDRKLPALWALLGEVLMALSDLLNRPHLIDEACQVFSTAVEMDRANYAFWLSKARCHAKLYALGQSGNHLTQAEQAFKSATALDDTSANLWTQWGKLRLLEGQLSRESSVIDSSLEKLKRALDIDPACCEALITLARAKAALGCKSESWDLLRQAEQHLLRVRELEPEHSYLLCSYALVLLNMGQYHEDARYLEKALQTLDAWNPSVEQQGEYWYLRAWILSTLGILRHDPTLLDDANQGFSRAAELSHGDTRPLYDEWGCCLLKLAEWTQEQRYVQAAVAKFERAVSGYENSGNSAPPLEWLYDYGCALDFLGDYTDEPQHYEKAIQVLSHIVQLDPEFWPARYNLALAWAHLGELTAEIDCFYEAISRLEEVIAHDTEDDHAWHELGITILDLAILTRDPAQPGRYQSLMHQAEGHLLKAAKLGHTSSLYSLAALYSQLDALDPAMHYLERARTAGTLPPYGTLLHDDWLENIRDSNAFQEFLLSLED